MGNVRRVGIAGAGWVTAHHLEAWSALKERASVVAIADPSLSAARSRSMQYQIPTVFETAQSMMDGAQLDVIDVAAPREFHAPISIIAAERGIAILCQKPLAPTFGEAVGMAERIGKLAPIMVHENWRFRPHYRQIRRWIDEGRIGDVRTVTMAVMTSGLLPDESGQLPALMRQPMLASLDRMLLMEVLIHHVDTLRFLLGRLELEGAKLGKNCRQILGEDRAALFMRTANGAAVSLIGDFMAFGRGPDQRDHLEIYGTAGSIILQERELRLVSMQPETLTLDLLSNYKASYKDTISHFLDRLDDGGEFETSVEDNLETLRIVEAAYEDSNNRILE